MSASPVFHDVHSNTSTSSHAMCDAAAEPSPAATAAWKRLMDLCLRLEHNASYADQPRKPEDFLRPDDDELEDLVGTEPLVARLRTGQPRRAD